MSCARQSMYREASRGAVGCGDTRTLLTVQHRRRGLRGPWNDCSIQGPLLVCHYQSVVNWISEWMNNYSSRLGTGEHDKNRGVKRHMWTMYLKKWGSIDLTPWTLWFHGPDKQLCATTPLNLCPMAPTTKKLWPPTRPQPYCKSVTVSDTVTTKQRLAHHKSLAMYDVT